MTKRKNPFIDDDGTDNFHEVDAMILTIREVIDEGDRFTNFDWTWFESVEEQFLSKGMVSEKQFEGLERIHNMVLNS